MDRHGASISETIESIQNKFKIKPFMVNIPLPGQRYFNSVIDLPQMQVGLLVLILPCKLIL
jgi:hypothetical protein